MLLRGDFTLMPTSNTDDHAFADACEALSQEDGATFLPREPADFGTVAKGDPTRKCVLFTTERVWERAQKSFLEYLQSKKAQARVHRQILAKDMVRIAIEIL